MICGGGSLPLAVADRVAARGRKVLLFPLRGAAEGPRSNAYRITGSISVRSANFCGWHALPAAATSSSSVRWCVRRSGRCIPTLRGLSVFAEVLAAFRGGDDHLLSGMGAVCSSRKAFACSARTKWRRKFWCREGALGRVQPNEPRPRRHRARLRLSARDGTVRRRPGRRGRRQACSGGRSGGRHRPDAGARCRIARQRPHARATGIGVLVKAPKRDQDRRFDLPSIGPQTVEGVARAGLAGIAVVAGETIIAEPERLCGGRPRRHFRHRQPAGRP